MTRRYLKRPNPEDYLTVKEIAEVTGFHVNTVYSWFRNDLLPVKRGVKKEYLARPKDLKKLLKKYYGYVPTFDKETNNE